MTIRGRLQQSSFSDPADEAVLGILMVAADVNQQVSQRCKAHGITLEQYNVLRILRGAGEAGLPRCDIAVRMISPSPDVTRMIDRMVKLGLVVRGWDSENRRLSIARITPAGKDVLAALDPEVNAISAAVTRPVPRKELGGMIGVLDRMLP